MSTLNVFKSLYCTWHEGQQRIHPSDPEGLLLLLLAFYWGRIPNPGLGRGNSVASSQQCVQIFVLQDWNNHTKATLSSFLGFDWCRFPDPGRGSRFASSKQCLWIFDPHPRCERGWKKIEIEILCWTLRYLHRVRWETDLNVKPFLSFVSGSKILTQEVETNIWTT